MKKEIEKTACWRGARGKQSVHGPFNILLCIRIIREGALISEYENQEESMRLFRNMRLNPGCA